MPSIPVLSLMPPRHRPSAPPGLRGHGSVLQRLLAATAIGATLALSACGGGSSGDSSDGREQAAAKPSNDAEAHRFLQQASFGPTTAQVAHLKDVGYSRWIDEQFDAQPQRSHVQTVEASAAALNRADSSRPEDVIYSWWTHAVRDEQVQLRHRVAFALSEIFVVSINTVGTGRTAASYLDMLTQKSASSYRDLLEGVAMHPAMGQYLSHMANVKADGKGRVPDENFAREVMQLFSIGLYALDDSGEPRLSNGKPVETYTASDIQGLARVFTGFSWLWPASKSGAPWWKCFWRSTECHEPIVQDISPMQGYTQTHEPGIKQFLGVTVPAQDTPDPKASLRVALDTLANHPNTAPFLSRQLIQRLVTSNPSKAYVADITRTFRQSGGNLRAVVKAILLHDEARHPDSATLYSYGKLREPVLRLAHLLRALPHSSDRYVASGGVFYGAIDTSDAASALGQTPMRSPSVFNFFRPGYRPPQSAIAAEGLVAPEAQIATETTALGYANFVAHILANGWGDWNSTLQRNDVQFDFSAWLGKAATPSDLIDTVAGQLIGHPLDSASRTAAVTAIGGMPQTTEAHKRQRVQAAVLLVAVSPAFMVQQ
ncbi:MAG: DUF1800 domain-containing protein [Proteobacteria bacterium]|uniref:DUF1800 family protein n=1 Tax=Aquabacterium sp. TaxID=1872578 RepID=UPI0035C69718|nr:DUF1800 domain-containing protein [Pseudomonadota bacterium]